MCNAGGVACFSRRQRSRVQVYSYAEEAFGRHRYLNTAAVNHLGCRRKIRATLYWSLRKGNLQVTAQPARRLSLFLILCSLYGSPAYFICVKRHTHTFSGKIHHPDSLNPRLFCRHFGLHQTTFSPLCHYPVEGEGHSGFIDNLPFPLL